ncbi:MAG: bifunctional 5,10-methylenetetrahydrofolate dehydrogenase/5,10-methenyltetrahydrofolate cyclohydrolase [Culicoidibacterales bacterium]
MKRIDGKAHAQTIYQELAQEVEKMVHKPHLVIVQVGNHPASEAYIRGKMAAANQVGIHAVIANFPGTITQEQLINELECFNQDSNVHGIIVQLPLPDTFDEHRIAQTIAREKDVDGFHPANLGELLIHETDLEPCTPKGIIELCRREQISLQGKHVVIVGRSNIVGKPVALLALQANATVTVCHSQTQNLSALTQLADILIVAVGRANFITAEMVKTDAIVIDVGINRIAGKLVGDVDFHDVEKKVRAITPVPGGVGPMTVAMLMTNTVVAAKNQSKENAFLCANHQKK